MTTHRVIWILVAVVAMPTTLYAQQADAESMSVENFVRSTYIEGVPYELAATYTAEDVPVLLAMLNDEADAPYWGNVAVTLCAIGVEDAVDGVISFIERDVDGQLTRSLYRAKSGAVMALGYSAYKNADGKSLNYLLASVNNPGVWNERGIEWVAPFQASTEERNADLTSVAVMGLALSGTNEARTALRSVQSREALVSEEGGLIDEALKTLDIIGQDGLSGYYAAAERR